MGSMRVMGRTGDIKITWDPENAVEVSRAREVFNENIKKGWAAFQVKRAGGKGKQVKEFDPQVEEILFVPPIAGGADALVY